MIETILEDIGIGEEPTPCNQSELIKAVDAGTTCFWVPSPKCPRCGSTLVSNGRDVWCSFVGGNGEKACSYEPRRGVRLRFATRYTPWLCYTPPKFHT